MRLVLFADKPGVMPGYFYGGMWGSTSCIRQGVGARDVKNEVRIVPAKPKKPCNKPGCPELTTGRFCSQHQSEGEKQRVRADKYYDQYQRDKQSRGFYKSRAWQAVRLRALVRDTYLCQDCLKENRIAQADTVHHRVPIREDWSKRLDMDNLLSLCSACHNKRHGKG